MISFVFVISAFMMGFLSAIPAGPIQIGVVRRAINGHIRASFMIIAGAAFSDTIYGLVAFFGIAPVLERDKVMAVFLLVGAILLIVIGIVIIRQSIQSNLLNNDLPYLKKKRWAFIGGLTISATNPMMIIWWVSGAVIFMDIGLIHDLTPDVAFVFLVAGVSGLASYLIILSLSIYRAKKFISENKMRFMNAAFGVILLFIAMYFLYNSYRLFSS